MNWSLVKRGYLDVTTAFISTPKKGTKWCVRYCRKKSKNMSARPATHDRTNLGLSNRRNVCGGKNTSRPLGRFED
jgi:hypothetical protein